MDSHLRSRLVATTGGTPPGRISRDRMATGIGIVALAAVVAAANYAVLRPINDWLTWGHFVFPIAFLVTDSINRIFGPTVARRVVIGGFLAAVLCSYWVATPRIAVASGIAFLVGQLLDVAVFDRLRRTGWWQAPAISSATASVVDTALFYSLAFSGSSLPWAQWATTDLMVKLLMIVPLLGPFALLVGWLLPATRRQ